MSDRRRRDLKLVRQSVAWNQRDESKDNAVMGLVRNYNDLNGTHLLIDDVHLSIMPYRGSKLQSFAITFTPYDEEVELLLEEAISRREHERDMTQAVSEFVRDCAASVMANGSAVYELAYQYAHGKPLSFMLLKVQPGSVQRDGARLVQYVPRSVATKRNLKRNFIDLTPENFVLFQLPTYIRSEYLPMMDALGARGDTVFPDFVLSGMEGKGSPIPFDLKTFDRTKKKAIAQASKLIGWDGRFLVGSQDVTEYYKWYRFLLFEHFKIELRGSIIETLNIALARAGEKIGFAAQLSVQGLPTLADVRNAQEALTTGSRPFGEILGIFRFN